MGVCSSNKNNNKDKDKKDSKDAKEESKEKKDQKKDSKEDHGHNENDESKVEHKPSLKEITFKFIEKGEEVLSATLTNSETISSLFEEVSQKLNKYSEYDLLTSQNESLKSRTQEKIYKLFPDKSEVELTLFYMGLEIPIDIRKEYETETTIIGTPLLDLGGEFGLVLYNKFNQTVTHTLVDNQSLTVFNHISSYCNGKNKLFISGGESAENQNEYISDFCAVDLFSSDNVEKLPELNEKRGWHSMLFVPTKYIFIVSGTSKTVELYDIDKKMITIDSELNEIRRESTLCCVNNSILYVFCGFVENEAHLNTIEQCNLRQSKRAWTYVNYSTGGDDVLFEQCYYISCYFSDNSIILFSSNENKNNKCGNILFDFEDEANPVIEKYDSEQSIVDVCPEKFFHPMSDKTSMLFPLTTSNVKLYKIDENMQMTTKEYPNIMSEIFE